MVKPLSRRTTFSFLISTMLFPPPKATFLPANARCLPLLASARCLVHAIDFTESLQEKCIAVIKAQDFGKLRAVACLVFYYLAPNLDPAEQQRPVMSIISVLLP